MKPIISKTISSFDKNLGTKIPFSWGGTTPKGNTIYFYNAQNQMVYENYMETPELYNSIPANVETLVNGEAYSIQIKVTDKYNNDSELSDKVFLYCYSTPVFTIGNINDGQKITQPTIDIYINYSQAESEELNSYQYYLYNYNKQLINTSDVYYDINYIYKIYGLTNNIYYIRAVGQTVNRIDVDTGYIRFEVEYNNIPSSTIFNAENIYRQGNIKLSTNIISQNYETNNATFDSYGVDIINGYVSYNNGVLINGDFSSKFTFKNPKPFCKIISFKNNNDDEISIRYMLDKLQEEATQAYFLLEVKNKNSVNNCTSKSFDILSSEEVNLVINRKDNIFDMQAKIKEVLY